MLEIMMGKISEIIIGKLLDEAYGCIKRFFFPKKKYINRLTQIIYKTIEEFEKEQSQKREIGKFPFYHSQILFEKLTKYVLFKKEEIDIDLLIREFNKNPNIVIPTEEELNSFYKLFYANLSKDEELKKLFTEENFQTEIFKISQKLCEVLKLLNDNNKMIKEMHNSIIPPKINLDIKKLDKKDFAYDSSVIEKNIYEPRYIKTSNNDFESFLSSEEVGITLSEIVTQKNRVVLLGNAGVGKTTELKMLFEQLWEKRDESLNIPMYINLKNFRKSADFEDLIPFAEWKELPITTFILDGLDEIAEIQDFISALELFLNKYKDKKINVVISCRTNIYEKYLVKILGFEYFFLNGLTDKQINNILEKRISKVLNYEELNQFRTYLENPFNLNLFCEYYKEKGDFPKSLSETWGLFIENELNKLNKSKLVKREEIDIAHIRKCLEKVAFVNELMKQNFILEDNLLDLLGKVDKSVFEQISFIEKLPDSGNFIFRHKNYQEFFAAKYLAEKSVEEILSIIKIEENINKTKPNLFNTITCLLNILDAKKFEEIKNWLLEKEPEILFLAEKDKLNIESQKEVFRAYFTEEVIENTFWIGRNGRFSMDKLAEFADIDFLISEIEKNEHFRIVISALDVLSYTECSEEENDKIKTLLERLIFSDRKPNIIQQAVRTFREKELYKDHILFEKMATHFKDNNSHEIHHLIISMISRFENVEDYFNVLKNSLEKLYGKNIEKDRTIRGTEWILAKIIFKIQSFDNFREIVKMLFSDEYTLKVSDFYNEDFSPQFIDKIVSFANDDKDNIFKIVDVILEEDEFGLYKEQDFLRQLLEKLPKKEILLEHIIENYPKIRKGYLIPQLFDNNDCVDYLVERNILFSDEDINYLRSHYFHQNHDLGYYFEKKLEEKGRSFTDNLLTKEQVEEQNNEYQKIAQDNFDLLFDTERLKKEVSKVFEKNNLTTIDWDITNEMMWKWYDETHLHGIQNVVFSVIENSIRDKDITKDVVFENIDDVVFLLKQIKNKIKLSIRKDYQVKQEQIEFIKEQCKVLSKNTDIENVIYSEGHSYYIQDKKSYNTIKILYFFDKEYNIGYSEEFYLKTLSYCHIIDDENIFEYIQQKTSSDKFKKQVIYNLENEKMFHLSLDYHIKYVVKNKIEECYPKVGDVILNDKYTSKDFLGEYVNLLPKNKQIDFLKKCCEDIRSYLCWRAIEILIEKNLDRDFVLDIAKKYLEKKENSSEMENGKWYISDALNVLFYYNDGEALILYSNLLKEKIDLREDYNIEDINRYNNFEKIEVLKDIFRIIYDENLETFDYYNTRQIFLYLVSNFSQSKEGFEETQKLLSEMKTEFENDAYQFHLNHYIENSKNAYYNSLSESYTFDKAKEELEK